MIVKRYSESELFHHGVKGQKWGIRRYQNEDGTLTEEGRRRFGTTQKFEKYHNKQKEIFQRQIHSAYAHNYAAHLHQPVLDEINKRYNNKDLGGYTYNTKEGQNYLKEYETTWKKAYKQSLNEIANKYETIGEDAIKNLDVTSIPYYQIHSMAAYIKDNK